MTPDPARAAGGVRELGRHALDRHAGEAARARRRASFFLAQLPGESGLVVAILVGPRWTPFLRRQSHIHGEPFFERDALASEPDLHANGHPFGWFYRSVEELLLDEARWLAPAQLRSLMSRLEGVVLQPAPQGLNARLEQLLCRIRQADLGLLEQ